MTDAHARVGTDDGVTARRSYGRAQRLLWALLVLLAVVVRLPAGLTSYPTPAEFGYVGACHTLVQHGTMDDLAAQGETPLSGWIGALPLVLLQSEPVEAQESSDEVVAGIGVVHRSSWVWNPGSYVPPWIVVALQRLPGILLALVGMALARRLGHRAFGRPGGWLAAGLWALAPPVIHADVALSGLRLVGPAALALVLLPMWLHDAVQHSGRAAARARRRLAIVGGLSLAVGPALWPVCLAVAIGTVLWRRHAQALGDKTHDGAAGRFAFMTTCALLVPWLVELPAALISGTGVGGYPEQLWTATTVLWNTDADWALAPLTLGLRLPLAVLVATIGGIAAWPTLRLDRAGGPTWLLALCLVPWTCALLAPSALVPALALAGLPGALGLGAAAIARHAVDAGSTARLAILGLILLSCVEALPHLARPRAHRNWLAAAIPEALPQPLDQGESSWQLLLVANALSLEHVRYLHALPPEAFDLLAAEHEVLLGAGELIGLRADLRSPLPPSGRVVALSDATTDLVALPDHEPHLRVGGLHLYDAR